MSQFERIAYIDRMLREEGTFKTKSIAQRFEVSERQVKRDIEYLRYRLDAPIEYSVAKRAYEYHAPFELLRFADERMLLFYTMVRSIATNETYLPIVSQEILEKIEQGVGKEYRHISHAIHYQVAAVDTINLLHFSILCQSMLARKALSLVYVSAKGKESTRQIETQRLVNYMGHWYLIAYDISKKELRTFHISRIENCTHLEQPCTWLANSTDENARKTELETYLSGGFGIFNGKTIATVTIRFYGDLVKAIQNQHWHKEQHDHEFREATEMLILDRTFPVANYAEILGRVLSYGAHAEVISPPDFRELWQKTISDMCKRAEGK